MIKWGQMAEYRDDLYRSMRAVKSYLFHAERKFSREEDYFHLRGQDNILRYRPVGRVVIRLHEDDTLFDTLGRIAAAKVSGCRPVVSIPTGLSNPVTAFLFSREGGKLLDGVDAIFQADEALIAMIPDIDRIRYGAPDRVPAAVFAAAARTGFYISRAPVTMDGRLELLQYYQQQSICNNYHRYGNLGERGL